MSEHTLNGIIVHLDTAFQKFLLKGFLIIQDIIDCPMNQCTIFFSSQSDGFKFFHNLLYYPSTVFQSELEPLFRCVLTSDGFLFDVEKSVYQQKQRLHPLVTDISVHQIVTGMELTGTSLYIEFCQILFNGLIHLSTVTKEVLDIRTLEEVFLLDTMITATFLIFHHQQFHFIRYLLIEQF